MFRGEKYMSLIANILYPVDFSPSYVAMAAYVNELRPACDALPLPMRRLITRMIASIPAFDKHSARYGHDSAVKAFRDVKGQSLVQAPLEQAEIDHTLLDLLVVDDQSGLPLGRPPFAKLRIGPLVAVQTIGVP
jgi:hypothetical protein